MQIRQKVIQLLLIHLIFEGGHQALSMQNRIRHSIIVCWSAARQVFLLVQPLQTWPVQRLFIIRMMTPRAFLHKNCVPTQFLWVQFGQWL